MIEALPLHVWSSCSTLHITSVHLIKGKFLQFSFYWHVWTESISPNSRNTHISPVHTRISTRFRLHTFQSCESGFISNPMRPELSELKSSCERGYSFRQTQTVKPEFGIQFDHAHLSDHTHYFRYVYKTLTTPPPSPSPACLTPGSSYSLGRSFCQPNSPEKPIETRDYLKVTSLDIQWRENHCC